MSACLWLAAGCQEIVLWSFFSSKFSIKVQAGCPGETPHYLGGLVNFRVFLYLYEQFVSLISATF